MGSRFLTNIRITPSDPHMASLNQLFNHGTVTFGITFVSLHCVPEATDLDCA